MLVEDAMEMRRAKWKMLVVYGSWSSQAAAASSTRSIASLTRRHHAGRERIAPCSKRGMMYKEGGGDLFESTPFALLCEGARASLLDSPSTRGEAFVSSGVSSTPPSGLGFAS